MTLNTDDRDDQAYKRTFAPLGIFHHNGKLPHQIGREEIPAPNREKIFEFANDPVRLYPEEN